MFTQGCFIRKNTKKLRDELEKLGYKNKIFSVCPDYYCIVCHRDGNFYTSDSEDYNGNYDESLKGLIDCGENEELFLAIAALRDDSNRFQWFTDGNRWSFYDLPKQADWLIDESWHKATIEELIEHFKEE